MLYWRNRPLENRVSQAFFFFFLSIFCTKYMSRSYPLSQRNHKMTDLTIAMIMIAILHDKLLFGVFVLQSFMIIPSFSYFNA